MPSSEIHTSTHVIFAGPKGDYEVIKKNMAGLRSPVALHDEKVIQFLSIAQSVNPVCQTNVNVLPKEDAKTALRATYEKMTESALIDERDSTAKLSRKITSDVARPNDPNIMGYSLLVKKNMYNVTGEDSSKRILSMLERTMQTESADKSEAPPVVLKRDIDPMCEFTKNGDILRMSFLHLFQLGQGCRFTGSCPDDYVQHLMLQWDNRFGKDVAFISVLFNQKHRHTVARETKGKVMNSKVAKKILMEDIFKPDFIDRIKAAKDDPNSKDAKHLKRIFAQIVKIGSSSVPFSPGERSSIQPIMYAYAYYFGFANVFNTIAPDSFMSILLNRTLQIDPMDIGGVNTSIDCDNYGIQSFIEDFRKFPDGSTNPYIDVPSNPARTAMFVDEFLHACASELYGLPLMGHIKKTTAIEERPEGIFGRIRGLFGVKEVGLTNQFPFLVVISMAEGH